MRDVFDQFALQTEPGRQIETPVGETIGHVSDSRHHDNILI